SDVCSSDLEHGPMTTNRRGSLRSRMSHSARRPVTTVCAARSDSGTRAMISSGEGMGSKAAMLRFSVWAADMRVSGFMWGRERIVTRRPRRRGAWAQQCNPILVARMGMKKLIDRMKWIGEGYGALVGHTGAAHVAQVTGCGQVSHARLRRLCDLRTTVLL